MKNILPPAEYTGSYPEDGNKPSSRNSGKLFNRPRSVTYQKLVFLFYSPPLTALPNECLALRRWKEIEIPGPHFSARNCYWLPLWGFEVTDLRPCRPDLAPLTPSPIDFQFSWSFEKQLVRVLFCTRMRREASCHFMHGFLLGRDAGRCHGRIQMSMARLSVAMLRTCFGIRIKFSASQCLLLYFWNLSVYKPVSNIRKNRLWEYPMNCTATTSHAGFCEDEDMSNFCEELRTCSVYRQFGVLFNFVWAC